MKTLEINHLSLDVEGHSLLKQVNLDILPGKTLALLGPNGAGKSSLIDTITQSLKPSAGTVHVLGQEFQQVKQQVGVLYEDCSYFPFWKVKEIIRYIACIQRVKLASVRDLVQGLGVTALEDKFIKNLSKGERKKVSIVLATLHHPDFLILDEPTSDLDPFIRDVCWKLFKKDQRTLLFTTHQWEEAERYADQIAFIHDGEITAVDTPEKLLSHKYIKADRKVIVAKQQEFAAIVSDYDYMEDEDHYYIFVDELHALLAEIQGITYNYSIVDKDLKDVYWYLYNHKPALS